MSLVDVQTEMQTDSVDYCLIDNCVFYHLGDLQCCHMLLMCHQEVIGEQETGSLPSFCLLADL